jgi:SseB protein N-terminal domain
VVSASGRFQGPPERHPDAFVGATVPTPPLPDDDGSPSAALMDALDRLAVRPSTAPEVLQALSSARLFVPVVAVLDPHEPATEPDADGLRREKSSSMAAVLVESVEHGRAQLAFSSIASLSAWNRSARPVPVMAPVAARAAVDGAADALLVDIGGPVPFALTGAELLLMASLASPPPGEHDPGLVRAVHDVVHRTAPVAQIRWETPTEGTVRLLVVGVPDEGDRVEVVRLLSEDRVLRRLLPGGMRVVFGDTP